MADQAEEKKTPVKVVRWRGEGLKRDRSEELKL
jgi:hypothetical protein